MFSGGAVYRMRRDHSGEPQCWRFERAAAAPPQALFQVASLRGNSSGGGESSTTVSVSEQRKQERGLIRRASDAQRALAEAVVEAQWAELGSRYGSQILNCSNPKVDTVAL